MSQSTEAIAHEFGAQASGDRIMKVNHAGEHGAVNIYRAQIFMARFTAPSLLSELIKFRSHEERHRAIFAAELQRRHRPRCKSYWLCGSGGYLLGLFTGLFGASAIAATTLAVENVVLRHLEHQLAVLRDVDPAATEAISSIVSEETQHRDQSAAIAEAGRFWRKILVPIVSVATEAVIWFGMRFD